MLVKVSISKPILINIGQESFRDQIKHHSEINSHA